MEKVEFDELVASVKEAGRIRRGQQRPARVTEFAADDVRAVRDGLDGPRKTLRS